MEADSGAPARRAAILGLMVDFGTPAWRAASMAQMVNDLLEKFSDLDACIRLYQEAKKENERLGIVVPPVHLYPSLIPSRVFDVTLKAKEADGAPRSGFLF